jgi:hypothetical protein
MTRLQSGARAVVAGMLGVLALGSTAAAQTETAAREHTLELLRSVPAGTLLRVAGRERTFVGPLERVGRDTIQLGAYLVPLASIERVQLRQRATLRGLKLGTLIGAPTGALTFGLGGLWASGFCEYDCPESAAGYALQAAALGAVLGAITGAATGAMIGASTTRWTALSEGNVTRLVASARSGGPAARRTIGSVSAAPAFTLPVDGDGSGYGGRAALLFHRGNFALGPELGFYELGSRQRLLTWTCDAPDGTCSELSAARETVAFGAAATRIGTGARNIVEPYATAGVGLYSWGTDIGEGRNTAGYSIGGGVQLRTPRGWHGAFLEARWQSNMSPVDDRYGYGFVSLSAGGALAW